MAASRVAFANTLRGVAALCVVVQHYGHVFWNERAITAMLVNAPRLPSPPDVPAWLRWVGQSQPFEYGQFGVGLFFLISGFVIPFSFASTTWRGFAVGRLTRIYPTFMVGFACTALAVWACGHHFGRAFPYDTNTVVWQFFPGLNDLALTPGIDGIIWTLNIEMKFYLVCLLMAAWFARGSVLVFIAPLLLTAFVWAFPSIAHAVGQPLALRGPVIYLAIMFMNLMFVGVAFNYLARGWLTPAPMIGISVLLCGAMALVWNHTRPLDPVWAWSYAAALVVFSAAYAAQHSRLFRPWRVTEFFADISYPLYLVHGVIGYVLLRIFLDQGWPASLAAVTTTGLVVAFAWGLHRVLEMPTHHWGKRVARRWAVAPRVS